MCHVDVLTIVDVHVHTYMPACIQMLYMLTSISVDAVYYYRLSLNIKIRTCLCEYVSSIVCICVYEHVCMYILNILKVAKYHDTLLKSRDNGNSPIGELIGHHITMGNIYHPSTARAHEIPNLSFVVTCDKSYHLNNRILQHFIVLHLKVCRYIIHCFYI